MARALEGKGMLDISLNATHGWPWQTGWKLLGPTDERGSSSLCLRWPGDARYVSKGLDQATDVERTKVKNATSPSAASSMSITRAGSKMPSVALASSSGK